MSDTTFDQVVGIPHWNDHSLKTVIDETNFTEEVKDILTAIHKMTVRFCQDHGLNHESVSITSGHFVEILSRIEEGGRHNVSLFCEVTLSK